MRHDIVNRDFLLPTPRIVEQFMCKACGWKGNLEGAVEHCVKNQFVVGKEKEITVR